jgi:hypothetical protein
MVKPLTRRLSAGFTSESSSTVMVPE